MEEVGIFADTISWVLVSFIPPCLFLSNLLASFNVLLNNSVKVILQPEERLIELGTNLDVK